MKTFAECLQWMEDVNAYRDAAPEGVFMTSSDRVITLRGVDPEAITQLAAHFTAESAVQPRPIMKWKAKLEGSEGGAFYSLTVQRHFGTKAVNGAWRFFYRKSSVHDSDSQ